MPCARGSTKGVKTMGTMLAFLLGAFAGAIAMVVAGSAFLIKKVAGVVGALAAA